MYKKITYSLIILLSFFIISNVEAKEKTNLYIFYGETCPYCEEEITYLKKIEKKYKNIKFNYIEVWEHKDNEKLLEQVKEGKYIIMSSHQMASIEEFCEDILILKRGKTVLQGNLKSIKDTYPVNRLELSVNENIDNYIKDMGFIIENENNNYYTIKIEDEEKPRELLNKLISNGIAINKFEIKKPTLNDIFIEKVGE